MGIVVDSSVLIAAERRKFDLPAFYRARPGDTFHVAAITASELLHGVERSVDRRIQDKRQRFVEGVFADFAVLPFGLREAREHSRLWVRLERAGQMIGPHDMEIAATALVAGFGVATLNRQEFDRVPGINLIDVLPFAVSQFR